MRHATDRSNELDDARKPEEAFRGGRLIFLMFSLMLAAITIIGMTTPVSALAADDVKTYKLTNKGWVEDAGNGVNWQQQKDATASSLLNRNSVQTQGVAGYQKWSGIVTGGNSGRAWTDGIPSCGAGVNSESGCYYASLSSSSDTSIYGILTDTTAPVLSVTPASGDGKYWLDADGYVHGTVNQTVEANTMSGSNDVQLSRSDQFVTDLSIKDDVLYIKAKPRTTTTSTTTVGPLPQSGDPAASWIQTMPYLIALIAVGGAVTVSMRNRKTV